MTAMERLMMGATDPEKNIRMLCVSSLSPLWTLDQDSSFLSFVVFVDKHKRFFSRTHTNIDMRNSP